MVGVVEGDGTLVAGADVPGAEVGVVWDGPGLGCIGTV